MSTYIVKPEHKGKWLLLDKSGEVLAVVDRLQDLPTGPITSAAHFVPMDHDPMSDLRAKLAEAERENARLRDESLVASQTERFRVANRNARKELGKVSAERDAAQAEVTRLESEANIESIKLDAQRSAGDALMKMLERATAQRDEATALLRRSRHIIGGDLLLGAGIDDFLRKVGAP